MHEDVAREQSHNLVGRYPTVGATDPQVGGRLLAREFGEKFGVLTADSFGPFLVVLEQIVEGAHVGATLNVRACFGKNGDIDNGDTPLFLKNGT
jgi:hypothetical protein